MAVSLALGCRFGWQWQQPRPPFIPIIFQPQSQHFRPAPLLRRQNARGGASSSWQVWQGFGCRARRRDSDVKLTTTTLVSLGKPALAADVAAIFVPAVVAATLPPPRDAIPHKARARPLIGASELVSQKQGTRGDIQKVGGNVWVPDSRQLGTLDTAYIPGAFRPGEQA